MSAVGVRPPISDRLKALFVRHSPREPVVAQHARASREAQATKVFPSEDRRGGVKDVENPLPREDRECIDPMCKLRIVIVPGTTDQVIAGECTSQARAIV
jgi:hypothetical protein